MTVSVDIDKRNVIKNAAKELFFRFGYSKTSMTDIARQSDLAKPSLYYYYKSKEEIFDEIVVDEAQSFMNAIEKKINRNLPAEERLVKFIKAIYNGKKFYAAQVADCPAYLREHSPHGHPIIEKMRDLFRQKLITILSDGQKEGTFEIEDVQTSANTISFMMAFMNLDWLNLYPEEERDSVLVTVIHLLVFGLKRRN